MPSASLQKVAKNRCKIEIDLAAAAAGQTGGRCLPPPPLHAAHPPSGLAACASMASSPCPASHFLNPADGAFTPCIFYALLGSSRQLVGHLHPRTARCDALPSL